MASGDVDVAVTASGLDISPELSRFFQRRQWPDCDGAEVSGQADVTLQLKRTGRQYAARLVGRFRQSDAVGSRMPASRAADRCRAYRAGRSPAPIDRAIGRQMRAGQHRHGDESCRAGRQTRRWLPRRKSVGLTLTEELETSLPESQARIWKRFRPIGRRGRRRPPHVRR